MLKTSMAAAALLASITLAGCDNGDNDLVCPPNSVKDGDQCHVTVPALTESEVPTTSVVPSTQTGETEITTTSVVPSTSTGETTVTVPTTP